MQVIKYQIATMVNRGTEEEPVMVEELADKVIDYSSENLEIAKSEAYQGKYAVEERTTKENER